MQARRTGLTPSRNAGSIWTGLIDRSKDMAREVQASEAKTHFARLLDVVERGETIIITRHGQAIARIVPEASQRQREIDEALADIEELRKHTGKVSIEEILALRHEGHKY
jgi:prevent-host-death family protein